MEVAGIEVEAAGIGLCRPRQPHAVDNIVLEIGVFNHQTVHLFASQTGEKKRSAITLSWPSLYLDGGNSGNGNGNRNHAERDILRG
jgi:hypothetical protein